MFGLYLCSDCAFVQVWGSIVNARASERMCCVIAFGGGIDAFCCLWEVHKACLKEATSSLPSHDPMSV
eukprot:6485406-Amphidinium_carterae.2